ncbi:MAG: rhomboid family intramembrane serine protease [Asticcacaulis sp.]
MTDDTLPTGKEPAFTAPLLSLFVPILIIGCYGIQVWVGPQVEALLFDNFALSPILLQQGQYGLLLTHLFLHGSWSHALFNAVFCLAFATPVIRAFGKGPGSAASYLSLFLLCGMVAGLGYCLLNLSSTTPVVGASGAIYGLIGASSRIYGVRGLSGGVAGLFDRRALSMAAVWCGLNLLTALLPYVPGGGGMQIAWQAHIVGYMFGYLIVGLWLHAFHPGFFTRN